MLAVRFEVLPRVDFCFLRDVRVGKGPTDQTKLRVELHSRLVTPHHMLFVLLVPRIAPDTLLSLCEHLSRVRLGLVGGIRVS